jgi:hypothetical protein
MAKNVLFQNSMLSFKTLPVLREGMGHHKEKEEGKGCEPSAVERQIE